MVPVEQLFLFSQLAVLGALVGGADCTARVDIALVGVTGDKREAKAARAFWGVKSITLSGGQEKVVNKSLGAVSSLHTYAASNLTNTLISGTSQWNVLW